MEVLSFSLREGIVEGYSNKTIQEIYIGEGIVIESSHIGNAHHNRLTGELLLELVAFVIFVTGFYFY